MTMTGKQLQAAIQEQRRNRSHGAARYPANLRKAVADFVRAERSQGRTLGSIAEMLGLPVNTLRLWSGKHPSEGRLESIQVVSNAAPESPVLVTRSGLRVEGLSMSSVVELLERLG
jgi:hypothetical protein